MTVFNLFAMNNEPPYVVPAWKHVCEGDRAEGEISDEAKHGSTGK